MRSVCGEEEETEQNHLLQCDGCREFAHMDCYGVGAPPEGRLWLCDVCKLGKLNLQHSYNSDINCRGNTPTRLCLIVRHLCKAAIVSGRNASQGNLN